MVSHLRKPLLNCFYHLFWFYLTTVSEFSCLAMLAKPYPVSGPTYWPSFPSQHHCMSKGAHEVLGTIPWARLMSVFNRNDLFCPYVTEALYLSLHGLSAAPLCYTCFDCGRIYPDFIDPPPGLDLLYLRVDLNLTCGKSVRFSKTNTKNEHKCGQTRKLFSV